MTIKQAFFYKKFVSFFFSVGVIKFFINFIIYRYNKIQYDRYKR